MKKNVIFFVSNNKIVLLSILTGTIIGYLYWHFFACYWGSYALSAECWVNCSFGGIIGGFLSSCIYKGAESVTKKNECHVRE